MLLADAALLCWASDIAARSPWMRRREANPPNRTKIAKKYANLARQPRLVRAEEVNSDICHLVEGCSNRQGAVKSRALYLPTVCSIL